MLTVLSRLAFAFGTGITSLSFVDDRPLLFGAALALGTGTSSCSSVGFGVLLLPLGLGTGISSVSVSAYCSGPLTFGGLPRLLGVGHAADVPRARHPGQPARAAGPQPGTPRASGRADSCEGAGTGVLLLLTVRVSYSAT